MSLKFKLLKDAQNDSAKAGTIVYKCRQCDYGLSSEDTRFTGIEHTFVTLKEDGGYPGFTIPVQDLERVE